MAKTASKPDVLQGPGENLGLLAGQKLSRFLLIDYSQICLIDLIQDPAIPLFWHVKDPLSS